MSMNDAITPHVQILKVPSSPTLKLVDEIKVISGAGARGFILLSVTDSSLVGDTAHTVLELGHARELITMLHRAIEVELKLRGNKGQEK